MQSLRLKISVQIQTSPLQLEKFKLNPNRLYKFRMSVCFNRNSQVRDKLRDYDMLVANGPIVISTKAEYWEQMIRL